MADQHLKQFTTFTSSPALQTRWGSCRCSLWNSLSSKIKTSCYRRNMGEIIMIKLQTADQHLKQFMSSPALQTRWGSCRCSLWNSLSSKIKTSCYRWNMGEIIMIKLQTADQHLKQFMSSPALQSREGTQRPPASSCTVSGTLRPFCPLSAGLCLLCTSSCSRPAVDSNKESKCLVDSSSTQQKHLTFFFWGGGMWEGEGMKLPWHQQAEHNNTDVVL